MDTLKKLDTIEGKGTSMITMIIAYSEQGHIRALDKLKCEYSVSANIKSRV